MTNARAKERTQQLPAARPTSRGSSAPMPAIRTADEVEPALSQNLAKGQTGLSIAFDLPTQTGYDSDHPLARGEVGKVGVPIAHLGDMRALFDGIPLEQMNTSMTINATAPGCSPLYIAVADEQGAPRAKLHGHDAERHHQGISVARHLRVPARAVAAADQGHDRVHHAGTARSGTRSTSAPITCRRRARRRCRNSPMRWRPPSPCSTR